MRPVADQHTTLVTEAEERARREHLAKATAIVLTLRDHIGRAGYRATDEALRRAESLIQRIRRGGPCRRSWWRSSFSPCSQGLQQGESWVPGGQRRKPPAADVPSNRRRIL